MAPTAASKNQIVRHMGDARRVLTVASIHIALVGTFTPRKCGIATFTSDIFEQLTHFYPEITVDAYALDRAGSGHIYDVPKQIITVDDAPSYSSAAQRINGSTADAVWIQHEFGIFGGNDGEAACDFVDQIAAPLIFTFHSVLASPSPRQFQIMQHLIRRAYRIMVMSQQGRELLINTYDAPPELIDIIHHGAPDRPFGRSELFKARFGLTGRNVLMTFGLLGPDKGLEHVIEALPAIVAEHPETIYRIVGATHPNLIAEQGEAYRESLQALADRLGVDRHIAWDNRFLNKQELIDQLEACDVYITPYLNLQQSTSGTLAYAVALGKAVVSTPYVHAREILSDGTGVLVEPHSHESLATAILELLDNRPKLSAIQRKAYERGRNTVWREFARAGSVLVQRAVDARKTGTPNNVTPGTSAVHDTITQTGMRQPALSIMPDRKPPC